MSELSEKILRKYKEQNPAKFKAKFGDRSFAEILGIPVEPTSPVVEPVSSFTEEVHPESPPVEKPKRKYKKRYDNLKRP